MQRDLLATAREATGKKAARSKKVGFFVFGAREREWQQPMTNCGGKQEWGKTG